MANIKITELDAATTLASTDVVPVVDVSEDVTKKITTTNLFRTLPDGTAAAPALAFSSDQANGVYLAGTDTVGISTGGTQRVTVDGSGNVTISGGLTVEGQTTTVESTIVTIDDKNIELGSVASPSNTTADGGGITLKGATDKTIKWINSTGYWTFNTGIEVGGHLQIDDSNEIRVGTSQDLKIYHDGTNSAIQNATGNFYLYNGGNNIYIRPVNNEDGIVVKANAEVELFYNNVRKLETKSDGVDVTGEVQCDFLDVDGGVDINGGQVFYDATNNLLRWADGARATFGASNDLQIKHDGGNSFIDDAGTGVLYIRSNDLRLGKYTGELGLQIIADGETRLHYDNSVKLATKTGGIDVTGEVQCDTLDVDGAADITGSVTLHGNLDLQDSDKILVGTNDDLHIYHNGVTSYIDNTTAVAFAIRQLSDDQDIVLQSDSGSGGVSTYVRCDGSNGEVQLSHYGSQKFRTKSDGIDVTGEVQCDSLDVDGNGDIAGTLTSNRVVIRDDGSASPLLSIRADDNSPWALIVGNDGYTTTDDYGLAFYQNANGACFQQAKGNGSYVNFYLQQSDGTTTNTAIYMDTNRAVNLNYQNVTKLQTKSDGIDVTGEVQCDTLDVDGVVNIGAANTSDAQLEIGAGATGNRNAYVDLIGDTTYTDYGLRVQRDNGGANGASKILHRGTGDFRFVAQEAAVIEFFTSNTERLRLDSAGRLLLGTTTEGAANADNLTVADSGNCGITPAVARVVLAISIFQMQLWVRRIRRLHPIQAR